MKKLILFIFLLFWFNQIYAMNPADYLLKVPYNFKSECYEFYHKIPRTDVWDELKKSQTYKIKLSKKDDIVFTQNWFILPYKYYSESKNNYIYSSSLWINLDSLQDYNSNTFDELNSKTQNEIVLSFNETLAKDNFNFIFDYSSNNYYAEYYISDDKNTWNLVKKQDIETFAFKYLKIKFVSNTKESYLENIKVYELNFPKKSDTYLIKSFYNDDIEIYSKFNCTNKDFISSPLPYEWFSINKDTKNLEIYIEKNPKYDVYTKSDLDNDWVEDEKDNCKYRYNPDQSDINWDGVGDMCSDDDKDGIIWYYDNCIYQSNPSQIDINRNWVGDVCEFDKDKDGVFDSIDNCINTANSDQTDDDHDWIWNSCDNCKSYNPSQLDLNNNGIWDVCEEIEKNLKENDKDNDQVLDYKDNCKGLSNPDQADDDQDWVWNACDNCLKYQNKDQLDFNKNWVWDICEDSDKDWIEWLQDNCINITNVDQKDSDNDGIWDVCEDDDRDNILAINDNCPFSYNPDQIDVDKDNIWDACDKKDNRFMESNWWFFIWLIIFITLVFFYGTFLMLRKLK